MKDCSTADPCGGEIESGKEGNMLALQKMNLQSVHELFIAQKFQSLALRLAEMEEEI